MEQLERQRQKGNGKNSTNNNDNARSDLKFRNLKIHLHTEKHTLSVYPDTHILTTGVMQRG